MPEHEPACERSGLRGSWSALALPPAQTQLPLCPYPRSCGMKDSPSSTMDSRWLADPIIAQRTTGSGGALRTSKPGSGRGSTLASASLAVRTCSAGVPKPTQVDSRTMTSPGDVIRNSKFPSLSVSCPRDSRSTRSTAVKAFGGMGSIETTAARGESSAATTLPRVLSSGLSVLSVTAYRPPAFVLMVLVAKLDVWPSVVAKSVTCPSGTPSESNQGLPSAPEKCG